MKLLPCWAPALLLLACHQEPDPAAVRVFGPWLQQLDRDGDGRVTARDYDEVAFSAPSFTEVDENGDGELDAAELTHLVLSQDPTTFEPGIHQRQSNDISDKSSGSGPANLTHQQIIVQEIFDMLLEDLPRDGSAPPLLTEAEVQAAVQTGSMRSASCQALLQRLKSEYDRRGLTFPPGLLQQPTPPSQPPQAEGAR